MESAQFANELIRYQFSCHKPVKALPAMYILKPLQNKLII